MRGKKVSTLVFKLFHICVSWIYFQIAFILEVQTRVLCNLIRFLSLTVCDTANLPGWKCCKPRVLTFEEFLAIPPCTTGKHSTVDDTPAPEPKKVDEAPPVQKKNERPPIVDPPVIPTAAPPAKPVIEEPESDDPDAEIPANATCRRRGCGTSYSGSTARDEEKCVHHPGQPVFHEGSKGWSCCKRRVLEFDEFLKIPGCTEKTRHLFVGKAKPAGEEKVNEVRCVPKTSYSSFPETY